MRNPALPTPGSSLFLVAPERLRIALLRALKPLVFPIWRFVDRWYYTEPNTRLAYISGSVMWWQLGGHENPRPHDPTTVEELLDELRDYADRKKPLVPRWSKRG